MAGLFTRRNIGRYAVNTFAGGEQCPIRGITKLHIEARHLQPAVGIPGPARPNVKQPGPGFREHFPSVDEVQIDLLTGA